MDSIGKIAGEIVDKARIAAAVFQELNQEETDKIVENVYKAGFNARIQLASNHQTGITEIAQPLGPIFAIIPVTYPTSTI